MNDTNKITTPDADGSDIADALAAGDPASLLLCPCGQPADLRYTHGLCFPCRDAQELARLRLERAPWVQAGPWSDCSGLVTP
jgi:hypothetical protein